MTEIKEPLGISFTELLDVDSHPVSEILREESNMAPGNTKVPAAVYHAQAWHDLEVEKLWSRVWQLACLEEEIAEVGDYHVYDIAELSFLIVRTAPDEIKAYRNACLHRGRKLRETHGKGAINLRCAFHGWCWNNDGSLKEIPCEWDFPDIDTADYDLPEAIVDTWQGFVFINPDPHAESLSDFLVGLDTHFEQLPFTDRYKAAHVSKIMPMNWKVCQEAFMESYHVIATHPTLIENLGDANSRYDVWHNHSRAISPHGIESPHLHGMPHYDQIDDGRQFAKWRHPMSGHLYERIEENRVMVTNLDGQDSFFDADGNWLEGNQTQADPHLCMWVGGPNLPGMDEIPLMTPDTPAELTEPGEIRAYLADQKRDVMRKTYGDSIDFEKFADAQMIDAIFYSVFPNWSPWGCLNPIFYRFRPNGSDPETCIMEVMFFPPTPPSGRPAPAKLTELGIDDDWTVATELGGLAKVFQQDSLNLPLVQKGLKAQLQQEVVFAAYNEQKIRHFYKSYFQWLEVDETAVSLP